MSDYFYNVFVNEYVSNGKFAIGYLYPAIRPIWIKNTIKKETIYESTGTIIHETNYEYDSTYHLLTNQSFISSNKKTYSSSYKYPFNYDFANYPIMEDFILNNMISNPIEIINQANGVVTNQLLKEYNYFDDDRPQLQNLKTNTGTNFALENQLTYLKYDINDNPIVILKNGVEESVNIWSYSGQYLVAEIKNESFTNVEYAIKAMFSIADINTFSALTIPNETKLQDGSLQNALPNAQVTTYTYKPLVGMTSQTDARGITAYYEYDTFNRLKETYIIENGEKKILQKYDYHYATQQ